MQKIISVCVNTKPGSFRVAFTSKEKLDSYMESLKLSGLDVIISHGEIELDPDPPRVYKYAQAYRGQDNNIIVYIMHTLKRPRFLADKLKDGVIYKLLLPQNKDESDIDLRLRAEKYLKEYELV
jgi:hypothetical protein